jgi:hypothetical protein
MEHGAEDRQDLGRHRPERRRDRRGGGMKEWNLIIDAGKYSNCNNCVMAVKDQYLGNDFPGYSAPQPKQGRERISIDRHVRDNGEMVDVTYVPKDLQSLR